MGTPHITSSHLSSEQLSRYLSCPPSLSLSSQYLLHVWNQEPLFITAPLLSTRWQENFYLGMWGTSQHIYIFYGVRLSASHPTPNLEDQGIPFCLGHHPWSTWHGRPYQFGSLQFLPCVHKSQGRCTILLMAKLESRTVWKLQILEIHLWKQRATCVKVNSCERYS